MSSRIYFEKFFSQNDYSYFLSLVTNEKIMVMNLGRVFSLEEAKNYYKYLLKSNERHEDFGNFKVFKGDTKTFIGLGALAINNDFSEAEVEYMLFPEYWGKGYGSEIVRELLKKAEEEKNIELVTATIDPNNIASKKILLNNGFASCKIYEGEDGSAVEVLSKKIIHLC